MHACYPLQQLVLMCEPLSSIYLLLRGGCAVLSCTGRQLVVQLQHMLLFARPGLGCAVRPAASAPTY